MKRATETQLPEPSFLNDAQVAALLGLSLATIRKWRFYRTGPPCFKVGSAVRYELNEVLSWARSKRAVDAA